ncbi:7-carboxy-7-deazaguanine synthase [bacterium]|nr:7-carboxy-7-deazaguanine synthase [bacterium]
MSYAVKTLYFSTQGEGHQMGTPVVFLRLAGCNLWSGREEHRPRAICQFCDTDIVGVDGRGGGHFRCAEELARNVRLEWARGANGPGARPTVVCTGGEPLLQVNRRLIDALRAEGFRVAIETNGTRFLPSPIDWVCVSPKAGSDWILRRGDELKLVFPQEGLLPENVEAMPDLHFTHWFLQPMDGPDVERNTAEAEEYCRKNPRWQLSRQMHKAWGID